MKVAEILVGYIDGACSGFSCKNFLNDMFKLRDSVNDFPNYSSDSSMSEA